MNVDYLFAALELWGGIFCVVGAVFRFMTRDIYKTATNEMIGMLLCSAAMMVSDLVSFFFRGQMTSIALFMVPIGNLLMFFLSYLNLLLFAAYLWEHSPKDHDNKIFLMVMHVICITGMVLTVISIFNNMYFYVDAWNYYHRGEWFWVSQFIGVCAFVNIFLTILHNRKYLGPVFFFTFTTYILFPFIMHMSQAIVYTLISRLNVGIEVSVLIILMVMMLEQNRTMVEQQNQISEQQLVLSKQERAINEMQIRLVISQIQPHFLYNALNAIYYLCEKDRKKAQMAINDFSDYLRGNMDALGGDSMIPVSKELQHVRSYLSLEKMRFDDDLQVEYNIQIQTFNVPALSLQPIVENAVKHGLGKKIGGGHLKISTYNRVDCYEIVIEDDGVGFDQNSIPQDTDRSHIGVENVRRRLAALCEGTMEIESTIGVGTTVTIRIPKTVESEA